MRLTCPGCGAFGSIELFSSDADARQFAALCTKVPPALAEALVTYLALFRPPKRLLTWKRARKLLEELLPAIQAAQVQRHGRSWSAPLDAWRQGMEQMAAKRDTLTLPLKSHGYLFEIVVGVANKAETIQEAQQEEQRRASAGSRHAPAPAPAGPREPLRFGFTETIARSLIAAENQVLTRMGKPPLTPDQEDQHLARMRPNT